MVGYKLIRFVIYMYLKKHDKRVFFIFRKFKTTQYLWVQEKRATGKMVTHICKNWDRPIFSM